MNTPTPTTPPAAISSGSFGFSYDALSRRTQMTRPNSVNTSYSYDNLSRLLSVLHTLNSTTIDGATYTVDAVGNRTAKTNQLNAVTENYGYDAIYQLTGVTQGANTTESYTYDPVGNRLSSLGVSPYTYNNSNQLTSTPSATYTYDNNGNTLTKLDASGATTYAWDFEEGDNFYRYVRNNPTGFNDPSGHGAQALAPALPLLPEIPVVGQVAAAGLAGWFTGRAVGHIPIGGGLTVDDAVAKAFTDTILWYRTRTDAQAVPRSSPQAKCDRDKHCEEIYEQDLARCWTIGNKQQQKVCASQAAVRYSECLRHGEPRSPLSWWFED